MNNEEKKLMMAMAKNISEQGEIIKQILREKNTTPQAVGNEIRKPAETITPTGGLEQKIEHDTPAQNMKIEVQFEKAVALPFDERMRKCESFLKDFEQIINGYGVSKLSIHYVRIT